MNNLKIRIEVEGTWCNNWPRFRITGNKTIYFDGEVEGKKVVEFTMPVKDTNQLTLQHYGKQFGENNIWDTHSDGDVILNDRAVRLLKLEFDEVDIKQYQVKHWPFITKDGQIIATDYFGFNGQCIISFTTPVYDWIITELVHDPAAYSYKAQDLIIETSHSDLFNYTEDLLVLHEIEDLLSQYAHLFNKSS